jgi:hypothetical protein
MCGAIPLLPYTSAWHDASRRTLHLPARRAPSVLLWLGYGLDNRGSISDSAGFLHQNAQTGSETHPSSYTIGIGVLSLGVKQPGRKANHSPSSRAEVMNVWRYISTLAWRGTIKHHRQFYRLLFTEWHSTRTKTKTVIKSINMQFLRVTIRQGLVFA